MQEVTPSDSRNGEGVGGGDCIQIYNGKCSKEEEPAGGGKLRGGGKTIYKILCFESSGSRRKSMKVNSGPGKELHAESSIGKKTPLWDRKSESR